MFAGKLKCHKRAACFEDDISTEMYTCSLLPWMCVLLDCELKYIDYTDIILRNSNLHKV